MCNRCYKCGKEEDGVEIDLRPYGLDGADVCYDCATATPEDEKITDDQMMKLMKAMIADSEEVNGIIPIIIDEGGIRKPSEEELQDLGITAKVLH